MNKDYDYESHWDKAYLKPVEDLGWYENDPISSLNLINKCSLSNDALLFNAGAGATQPGKGGGGECHPKMATWGHLQLRLSLAS